MKNKNTILRLSITGIAFLVTAVCTLITVFTPIDTTSVKIIGSFVSIIVVSLAAWKFPIKFYTSALIFHFFAASLGSVINLYKYVGFYDKLVHYLSGIILAEGGMLIISYIFQKRSIVNDHLVKILFSFFFSAACAGMWEIYEFTADQLINTTMQGGNSNTMGDIISGVLGALTFSVFMLVKNKIIKNDNISRKR